jgi:uncharacterized protein YqeY
VTLSETIFEDTNRALKAGDKVRLGTLRMIRAALKNAEITHGRAPNDDDVIDVLNKQAKIRRDAIDGAENAGRQEIVEKESLELSIIESYLPKALSPEELEAEVLGAIQATGASGPGDMGRVMGFLMPKVKGRADGNQVRELVQNKLRT